MTDIKVTVSREGGQYLLDAIDTHIKTHGLKVAPMGVMLLAQLQASATAEEEPSVEASDDPASD